MEDFSSTKKSKGNIRYITLSDNNPEHFDSLIRIARSYNFYAGIIHDKDIDDDGNPKKPHLHLVCYDKGGTTLKAHCERFSSVLPSNFICKVIAPKGAVRYLTHIDYPSKAQYKDSDIITNNMSFYKKCVECSPDSRSEFGDMKLVCQGKMSMDEFVEKYADEIGGMNFYQRISIYEKLLKFNYKEL